MQIARACVLGSLLWGCSPAAKSSPVAPPAPAPVRFVEVTLVGVIIAPVKPDGTTWDAGVGDAPAAAADIARAVRAPKQIPAILEVTALFSNSFVRPEVAGWVQMHPDARRIQLRAERDSFEPSFVPAPTFIFDLAANPYLDVHLFDIDLVNDDSMGAFRITARDLSDALTTGHVSQVVVAEQTGNRVLMATVAAVPIRTAK